MAKLVKLTSVYSGKPYVVNPIYIVDMTEGDQPNTTKLFLFTDAETAIEVEGDLDTVLHKLNVDQ